MQLILFLGKARIALVLTISRKKILKENPCLQGNEEMIKTKAMKETARMITRVYFFRPLDIVVLEQTSLMKKLTRIIVQEKLAFLIFRFSLYYDGDFDSYSPYHFDIYKDFVCLYYILSNRKLVAAAAESNWQKLLAAIKELNALEYLNGRKSFR